MDWLVLSLCAVGVAGWLVFRRRAVALRRLRGMAVTSVRDAREGQRTRIVGRVVHGEATLVAPISGRRCAAYTVTVTETEGESNSEVLTEIEAVDFFVQDATGTALVRTDDRLLLVLVDDRHTISAPGSDASPGMEGLLARHGKSSKSGIGIADGNRTLSYKEAVLEAGEEIAVLGVVRIEGELGYRESGRRVVLVPPDEGELIASDVPRARRPK